jgi:diguanylate cyclase (GGDEF)-like protein
MNMDKRASTRYVVSLNALVHPTVGRSWLCQIGDFCDAGMLLAEQNGRPRRSLPGIVAGETVGIHFSVPGEDGDRHFRLEGKIVRLMDTGVGINFPSGMDAEAFECLSQYSGLEPLGDSESAPAADQGDSGGASQTAGSPGVSVFRRSDLTQEDTRRVVGMLRKAASQALPQMAEALFKHMDSELLDLAKNAKSNAEQSEYFSAMSTLEKAKKGLIESVVSSVLHQVDEPRDLQALIAERKKANDERKAQAQSKVKLSLVNTEDFEDWLAVANIVSRSERMYEQYLSEMTRRMGMLVDSWGHLEANPLGTAVITHAFDDRIQTIDLTQEIRQKAYTGYEKVVLPLFRQLYISITKRLEETGLFPDLDDDYISPSSPSASEESDKQAEEGRGEEVESEEEIIEKDVEGEENIAEEAPRARSSRRRSSGGRSDAVEDDEMREPEPEAAAEGDAPRRSLRRTGGRRASDAKAAGRRASDTSAGEGQERRGRRRTDDVGDAIRNVYQSVRQLLGSKGRLEEEYGPAQENTEYFGANEVQDLLSAIEDEALQNYDRRMPVRRRLMETASRMGDRRISPDVMQNIEVVENLVDTIEEDPMVPDHAKGWIRQLELTLDKVATEQEDFLSEKNPHQSLEVINSLARLGGVSTGNARRTVDGIIEDINNNYDESPEVFDRALKKLRPLVERQNKAFTGNVQRTVKASQGQQTLHNAQRAVVSEMDERYAGKEIPEVLFKLLMPGWRNLLVNTHLRQGEDSSDWKKHVQALDQVFKHLDPDSDPVSSPDYMEPDELIRHIEEGLGSISYEPGMRIPLVNSLRQIITGGATAADLPSVQLGEGTVAEELGFADLNVEEESRQKLREAFAEDSQWQRFYDRAHRLHVGAWVEFSEPGKEEDISIVAWVNDDGSRLVFVNRRGVRTHDISVEQMATLLQEGQARILEESDIPLTDRASHRMLQNMHNQLTHQATHDDLTGLLNRKEFERELDVALEEARKTDSTHLYAHLDLDQFKVINNTVGHDAGDRLLVTIADVLRDRMDGEVSHIARLSGDEFGLLVYNCRQETGQILIKSIADAVKAVRFEWEGDTYSLTVSCGLFYLDQDTESVIKIFSGGDAACIAAKEAGRDRIQEFKEDDSEMEHRKGIMEFVSQIDRALDEDRFLLNCQKILPIDPDDPDVHYEILLSILDEDNNALPPQDFIIAAERYNRMGAVDRWVIRNAFEFIASNILKLENLGIFSINLSGNSLTEDDFMEFVLEQFNKTRLPTSMICFEITETSAIGRLDDVVEFMEKMKVAGVQFSLDDFGTGLSSYSYLRNLPVDFLKIDGIFVKDIKDNPSDYAVVKSINEVGHFMGKKTIAEYCEDEEIIEILREIGVDYAQGWGVGKKIPLTEFLKTL